MTSFCSEAEQRCEIPHGCCRRLLGNAITLYVYIYTYIIRRRLRHSEPRRNTMIIWMMTLLCFPPPACFSSTKQGKIGLSSAHDSRAGLASAENYVHTKPVARTSSMEYPTGLEDDTASRFSSKEHIVLPNGLSMTPGTCCQGLLVHSLLRLLLLAPRFGLCGSDVLLAEGLVI